MRRRFGFGLRLLTFLSGMFVFFVLPVLAVKITAGELSWKTFDRKAVLAPLAFLPGLALSALLVHRMDRQPPRWSSRTILLFALLAPPVLVLANFLALAERFRASPRLGSLPRIAPMIVLGGAIYGLMLTARSGKARCVVVLALLSALATSFVEAPRVARRFHQLSMAADRAELPWKIPATGELFLAAVLLSAMRRLKVVRISRLAAPTIATIGLIVFLRPYEFPRKWRSEMAGFSGARLAPNGDLYLLHARRIVPGTGYDPLGIVRRPTDDGAFFRVTRRPSASTDLSRREVFSPDFSRVATAEAPHPLSQLLFDKHWVSKVYDVSNGREEVVPANDADLYYTSGLPPTVLPGPGRSWALVVESGLAGRLRSGLRFRVSIGNRIERIWIEGVELHAYVPGSRFETEPRRLPSILTIDLASGDTRERTIPLDGPSSLTAISPSGRQLLIVRNPRTGIFESYLCDVTGTIRLLAVTSTADGPAVFWRADGSAFAAPRKQVMNLIEEAVPSSWRAWRGRNWLTRVRLEGREIGGLIYLAALSTTSPVAFFELDQKLTRATVLSDRPIDYQWLPDSLLVCESSHLHGERVVRYWPGGRRENVFPLDARVRALFDRD